MRALINSLDPVHDAREYLIASNLFSKASPRKILTDTLSSTSSATGALIALPLTALLLNMFQDVCIYAHLLETLLTDIRLSAFDDKTHELINEKFHGCSSVSAIVAETYSRES